MGTIRLDGYLSISLNPNPLSHRSREGESFDANLSGTEIQFFRCSTAYFLAPIFSTTLHAL